MVTKTFIIPNFNFEDGLTRPLQTLLNIFKGITESETHNEIQIDFTEITFCSTFFLGILYTILFQFKATGRKIKLKIHPHGSLATYLDSIHFNKELLINSQRKIRSLADFKGKSYIPITHFPTKGPYIEGLQSADACGNALLQLIYQTINGDVHLKNDISYIISEMMDNVIDHSGAQTGVIYAQYYSHQNILDIIIADHGQGILKSFNRNDNFNPLTHGEAVEYAMDGKSSKEENETRGFGLETSRSRVMKRGRQARFMMWSGNALYLQVNEKRGNIINLEPHLIYKGCLVFIRVNC